MSEEIEDFKQWTNELKAYWEMKRTCSKEFFRNPNFVPWISHSMIKEKENQFDPILNKFK